MKLNDDPSRRVVATVVGLLLVAAACTGGGTPSTSPGSSTPASTAASSPSLGAPPASASAMPSLPPSASGLTADAAVRLVLASDSRFRGIAARDPNLIGQASWYEVSPAVGGFTVVVRIGWGDCPSGCIDEHRWTYAVSSDGAVRLASESGPAVPAGVTAGSGGSGGSGTVPPTAAPTPRPTPRPSTPAATPSAVTVTVKGQATAGPVCPVERVPPDPSCAPRPVAEAVLEITRNGSLVTSVTTDANGNFAVKLAPGSYTLVPQPVAGLMHAAPAQDFTVPSSGEAPFLEVSYDTGIR